MVGKPGFRVPKLPGSHGVAALKSDCTSWSQTSFLSITLPLTRSLIVASSMTLFRKVKQYLAICPAGILVLNVCVNVSPTGITFGFGTTHMIGSGGYIGVLPYVDLLLAVGTIYVSSTLPFWSLSIKLLQVISIAAGPKLVISMPVVTPSCTISVISING